MDEYESVSPLVEAGIEVHELFLAFQTAGFTESQALYIAGQAVAVLITAGKG